MELIDLARGYLRAEEYELEARGRDVLFGKRSVLGGDHRIYVYVPQVSDPGRFRSLEGHALDTLARLTERDPGSERFLLVPSLEGLTTEFRTRALRDYGIKVRVPMQFIDTEFTWERSPDARSAAKELKDEGTRILRHRAFQPFEVVEGPPSGIDNDILDALADVLSRRRIEDRSIHIVVGSAGMGKSHVFRALFARLYAQFTDDKRAQILAPRPLPLLPEFLPYADATNSVRSLLRAYLTTDLARPVGVPAFEWMMSNGLYTWMLDGLDEVIDQDPHFFQYLVDRILESDTETPPRILICVRDSLLVTNPDFRDFCDDWSHLITMYRLTPWKERSQREYGRLAIGPGAAGFVTAVSDRPALRELAGNAYYCALLTEQFQTLGLEESYSPVQLVEFAVDRILGREYEKQALDQSVIDQATVLDFSEAIAAQDFADGFRGVSVDEAREFATYCLHDALGPEKIDGYAKQLTRSALFSAGQTGYIRFAQDLVEQYFLGRNMTTVFDNRPEVLVSILQQRQLPSDWLAMEFLAMHVRERSSLPKLIGLLAMAGDREVAFKNLLQTAILAKLHSDELRDVVFERHNLGGVHLSDLDLRGKSFRGCDLSDVVFDGCDMGEAHFEDAIIRNTEFRSGTAALAGAHFGDLARFYSMVVDGRRKLASHREAFAWINQVADSGPAGEEPCAVALQIRQVFGKYIRPNGDGKRDWHGEKALLSGTRFVQRPKDVVEALVQYGYLLPPDSRGRYARADGDLYGEMRNFVMRMSMSGTLRGLMNETCNLSGCSHVRMRIASAVAAS